jgi:hypothetical protein
MTTILVVDIGGTNVKVGFTVDGAPHDHVRLFPSDEVGNRNPVSGLAGGVSSRSRHRRCFLKRRVSLNTFQARDVSAVGRRIFSLVLARVERDTSRPDCESQ